MSPLIDTGSRNALNHRRINRNKKFKYLPVHTVSRTSISGSSITLGGGVNNPGTGSITIASSGSASGCGCGSVK